MSFVASRSYILNRRTNAVADLSSCNLTDGELTVTEAIESGLYRVNSTHQVGIATATEVGLSAIRFPIRVVLGTAARMANQTDTCVGYWKLVNGSGDYVPYQRKPIANDQPLAAVYERIPNFDESSWNAWEAIRDHPPLEDQDAALNAQQETLFSLLSVINPTDEQIQQTNAVVSAIRTACVAAFRVPYFKVGPNIFLKTAPHGAAYAPIGTMSADQVAATEAFLSIMANYNALKARNPNCSDGVCLTGAYSIAGMFRMGLFESFEHKEYHTVRYMPVDGQPGTFAVAEVVPAPNCAAPASHAVGSTLSLNTFKVYPKIAEIGNLCVIIAGLMHYLFNHTTGGSVVTGPLLTVLAMYNLVSASMTAEQQTLVTTVMYECLHPVNKRAVANILLPTSKVTTNGRLRGAPRFERITLDSFTQIRMNPYPAGAHKAFICVTALKRVLAAQLGVFLPWADQLTSCINACKSVLNAGARAHVGSTYYTGDPPQTQPTSLDLYMPDLAQYVQTFNKGDSLCFSPHVGSDVAARSSMNWRNMLKDLKAKDVSATDVETVKRFLSTAGGVYFEFDPTQENTWAVAQKNQQDAIAAIGSCLST